jgi:GTPase SAR1 family protein
MGAANVGKSSFINRLLENKYSPNVPSKRGKDQQKLSKDVII